VTTRFAAPTTLDGVFAILTADDDARVVAGGTDLVVAARQGRRPLPESIVAIDRIPELARAEVTPDGLVLGALTSHRWLSESSDVRSSWSALADAAAIVGSPATRATGTIGGNVMNASPAAETIGPLVVFDAVAVLRGAGREPRRVPVADLVVGPGRTVAAADEILTQVVVRRSASPQGSAYLRLEYRRAMEIAVVGAAVRVELTGADETGTVRVAHVGLTAVAATIVRAPAAERALVGTTGDAAACEAAGAAAVLAASPIDDVRASADYRRAMLAVVVARASAAAVARARGVDVPVPASRWMPDGVG
jgi:CO/xanthine dehydrogenase FAD-binding subunit